MALFAVLGAVSQLVVIGKDIERVGVGSRVVAVDGAVGLEEGSTEILVVVGNVVPNMGGSTVGKTIGVVLGICVNLSRTIFDPEDALYVPGPQLAEVTFFTLIDIKMLPNESFL